MENLIERVARFADADTRRVMGFGDIDKRLALGFLPRRLVVPDLKLTFKETRLMQGYYKFFDFGDEVWMWAHPNGMTWTFGKNKFVAFQRDGLVVNFRCGYEHVNSRHPDFNEDGSFKRSRPSDSYGEPHRAHSTSCRYRYKTCFGLKASKTFYK